MKKIALLLAIIMLTVLILPVYADGITDENDFVLDGDGCLVSYTGEYYEVLVIPSWVNGKSVEKLGEGLFQGKPVGTVYLNEEVKEIGANCFADSTLDYIDIPAGVTYIGDGAFKNCSKLNSMTIGYDEIKFGKDALAGTGFLHIAVTCTMKLNDLHDRLIDAKGDENFTFDIMHTGLVESMVEKDMFGHSMMFCEDCGFKGSIYLDDVSVPFTDVSSDAWYYPYVSTAYEFGILNGKSADTFDPTANMTLAEAAKIAACIDMYYAYEIETLTAAEGEKWYQPYVDYCYKNNIIDSHIVFDWDKKATRAEMAYLFSRADRSDIEINPDVPLTDIPDVDTSTSFANEILYLYRHGIATGSDEYYTFYPDANVKRSEAAAFISRIICYDMRVELPKG